MAVRGGCLCEATRYEVELEPATTASYCHCRTCQKSCAGPVGLFFLVQKVRFTWMTSPPAGYMSSQRIQRQFCSTCGSQLTFVDKDTPDIHITVASLDRPEAVAPSDHIFFSSRIRWFDTTDRLPRFETSRGAAEQE